jgi:hypothetical protein
LDFAEDSKPWWPPEQMVTWGTFKFGFLLMHQGPAQGLAEPRGRL